MSGTLTRLQMATEVLDNISRSSVGQTRSQTTLANRVVTWLDRAGVKIARQEDLLFQIATAPTVADQLSYVFPENIRAVYSLRLEDGNNSIKLQCYMPWEFDQMVPKPDTTTTARPSVYIPYKTTNTFELYSIPDDSYTMRLRYSYWPASLTTDSSVSDYTYMDDVLIYYATSEGFKWLQELKDADFWQKRGDEALVAAIKAEREAYPDWEQKGRGFSSQTPYIGEYYNDPFVREVF
jgi:hypothetical protein